MMRKSFAMLLALSILSVFSYGCATKDYVKQQIDPLVDRISKLETSVQGLKECCAKADAAAAKAEAAAKAAEASAKAAEAAAKKAQVGAEKATKSFELHQAK